MLSNRNSKPPSFSSDLAKVVFGSAAAAPQPLLEDHVVARIEAWLNTVGTEQLYVLAGYIDRQLVSILPVAYQSRVAQLIERKDPQVLARMPTLRSRQTHLAHAMELALIFRSANLRALLAAVEDEKRRGGELR